MEYNGNKKLKIDKRLPQIVVPESKIQMFVDWWNEDIRFENTIPQTFSEGYLIIDNLQQSIKSIENYKDLIKTIAKEMQTTYRKIENYFIEFRNSTQHLTIYFKFLSEITLLIEIYNVDGSLMTRSQISFGKSDPERIINLNKPVDVDNFDDFMHEISYDQMGILISCLWYIATTKNTTKYIYEKHSPIITHRKKNTVQVSNTKTISTPIYDMNKIRTVKVEKLTQRKKGWTYSHSFQVHGHYRHYKNGKTIFIKSFVKGANADKEFKSQKIILSPTEN